MRHKRSESNYTIEPEVFVIMDNELYNTFDDYDAAGEYIAQFLTKLEQTFSTMEYLRNVSSIMINRF